MDLFRSFLIVLLFTFSLYAADVCSSDAAHNFSSATYSDATQLGNGGEKSYYFYVPAAGSVTFSLTDADNQLNFYYNTAGCATTSSSTIADGTVINFAGASEFYLLVTSRAANQDYDFTMTFATAPVVSISCPSNSIVEGNISNTTTTCTISLNTKPLSGDIQLTVQGIDVTSSNGTDYNASDTNITFLQNTLTLSQSYSFDIIGDTTYEANETFNIRVINNPAYSSATQLRQLPADYPVTIINDDVAPSLSISIGNTSKTEGDIGTSIMNFPITLNAPATTDITVTYRFNDINTSSSDTNMTDGALYSFVIPSGTNVGLYAASLLGIVGDTVIESDETFSITLLTASDGVITNNTATGTIVDDDGGGGIVIPAYNPGTVDTVDVYTATGSSPFYEQVIKTKIAGQTNLTLDAVYLGLNAPFVPTTYTAANMPVIMYLYDAITGSVTKLYEQNNPNEPLAAVIGTDTEWGRTPLFTMPATASKRAYILMRYLDYSSLVITGGPTCLEHSSTGANAVPGMPSCVASDVQYLDAFHQDAYDRCKVQHGEPCKPSHHGYSGGGNPSYPGYDPEYDHKYGCYECTLGATPLVSSVDNFAIRPNDFNSTIVTNQIFTAGTPASLTFRADRFGGAGTQDYNETEHTSFVVDVNISNVAKVCQDMNISFSPNINFTNGTVTNNYTLNNVGDFNVTMHEIVGSEFAFVDTDDTNTSLRLISPYTQQIKVIPDHFVIDGNLTNGSNGFTYLSNFEEHNTTIQDRNISASLDLNVSARRADNNITSNYTSQCYAKGGNVTLSLAIPIAITPAGSLTKMIWYHSTPDSNSSVPLSGNTIYPIPFLSTQFDSNDTNGTAQFNYKINFDRNATKVVNPFMVVVTDINATDVDAVNGTNSVDSNATFLFGRTHASRQRYNTNTGPANIYYESFCFGALCDKALLPNGVNSTRTDDARWYVIPNPFHTTPTDGSIGIVVEKIGTNAVGDIVDATDNLGGNPSVTNLSYDGSKGYPYKTTVQNEASPWLIYNESDPTATRNEFQVEFDNQGLWTGDNNTSTTTNTPTDKAKTNRRIMW